MAFSLDTRNVKYLHNYEAALRHHDNTTPIRNSDCRPVENRRKSHFNIRKEGEGDGGKIIVRLYSTDIVTYYSPSHAQYPNQISLNMGNWPTVSTRDAVLALTKTFTTRQFGKTWVEDQGGKHYLFRNGMQLQAGDYYCNHKIIDPVYPETHTLKRKELNAKLKQFKNYYNYLLGLAKVDAWRGQEVPDSTVLNGLTNQDNYKDGMFEPEPEAAFELSKSIMCNHAISGRSTYWRFFVQGWSTPPQIPIPNLENVISNALKRAVIKTHKDELLAKVTVTDGRIVRDQYAWV
jgi:hypothetical protein